MIDILPPDGYALFEQVRAEVEQHTPDDERRTARNVATYAYRRALQDGANEYDALRSVYEAGLRRLEETRSLGETALPGVSPRVEGTIERVMARYPDIGFTSKQSARYYEDVHQELAPLARGLEQELHQAWRQVGDLSLQVGRLVRALRAASPKSDLPDLAVDHLRRNRLISPLREGDTVDG